MWERENGIKNTKICLAHITFSANIVPNMALHYLSMSNFLVFRTFDMWGFLFFVVPNSKCKFLTFHTLDASAMLNHKIIYDIKLLFDKTINKLKIIYFINKLYT